MLSRFLVFIISCLASYDVFAVVDVKSFGELYQFNGNRFTASSKGEATVSPPVLYVAVTTGWDFACPFHGVPTIKMQGSNVKIGAAVVERKKNQEINPGYGNWAGSSAQCTLFHSATGAAGQASVGFQYQGLGVNYSLASFDNIDGDTEIRTFTKPPPPPPAFCPCDNWNPDITCQIP